MISEPKIGEVASHYIRYGIYYQVLDITYNRVFYRDLVKGYSSWDYKTSDSSKVTEPLTPLRAALFGLTDN